MYFKRVTENLRRSGQVAQVDYKVFGAINIHRGRAEMEFERRECLIRSSLKATRVSRKYDAVTSSSSVVPWN